MTDGPLPRYRALVSDGALNADPAQRLAAEKLQLLHGRLKGYDPKAGKKVRLGLFGWGRERVREADIPGLYIYGGVGRGKSMLMDLFFETAPVEPKRRVHFHAFMQDVHERIGTARARGQEDPVEPVAEAIAEGATLLCFDEMQITDITDAMLVGRLFEKLFARGVIVVATSNRHPDALYENGLNRQLFLPFIALIKERMEVHELSDGTDHRTGRLEGAKRWFAAGDPGFDALWGEIAGGDCAPLVLHRKGREVVVPRFRNGAGRGDFAALCGQPLGPGDYLAIADAVRVLFIEDVPTLSRARANEAKRFVTLIDALYEAKAGLVASAAAEPEALYPEGDGAFEFQRTVSRLHEMRSAGWGED
ncbi:cell division protein ZapE [Pontivivens ytuae]|uniref:AFG1 family ATPase n=1 Tax=Pontivivens ytuae TaxID=2789856 RepID=A0A7S9LPL4_9RHOB|nr:cell division protein ZapE [Pontivivens ytuae]QPH52857.1 AFG1 family ATPase [Pontivivens ytuae]